MKEMRIKCENKIVFHPTNSATTPTPENITDITNHFPYEAHKFDEFFLHQINTERTNYRVFMKVTVFITDIELQIRMKPYLRHHKLWMNNDEIDEAQRVVVGFIHSGSKYHNRTHYTQLINDELKKILNDPESPLENTLKAQIDSFTTEVKIEIANGGFSYGPKSNRRKFTGVSVFCSKRQFRCVSDLLSMLPDDLLGNLLSVVPKAVEKCMGHVYFENMIRESEQATANTVGIVIE